MGWKFWKPDAEKTDAQRSLEQLSAAEVPLGAGAPPAASPTQADSAALQASFTMEVESVFAITGRNLVVTGKVTTGEVREGQRLSFTDAHGEERHTTVTSTETLRGEPVDQAKSGDDIALLLTGITREDIARGTQLHG